MSETNPTPPAVPPPSSPILSGGEPDKDSKMMAMIAHLLGILGPVGPLIVWLIKKDQQPFVNDQGREALNFEITMAIPFVVLLLIGFTGIGACLTLIAWPIFFIINAVFCVMGAMKANTGMAYRYPVNLRLIK
jgi:uncharacterized Tic20 family protein